MQARGSGIEFRLAVVSGAAGKYIRPGAGERDSGGEPTSPFFGEGVCG